MNLAMPISRCPVALAPSKRFSRSSRLSNSAFTINPSSSSTPTVTSIIYWPSSSVGSPRRSFTSGSVISTPQLLRRRRHSRSSKSRQQESPLSGCSLRWARAAAAAILHFVRVAHATNWLLALKPRLALLDKRSRCFFVILSSKGDHLIGQRGIENQVQLVLEPLVHRKFAPANRPSWPIGQFLC